MSISPILILHVSAGTLGALTGAIALSVRKGARLHRLFGSIFVASMLTMAATATYLSLLHQPGTFITSIFTFYLMATAWIAVRRKEASTGLFEKLALGVVLACAAGTLYSGAMAAQSPTGQFLGYPAGIYYALAVFMVLMAVMDVRVILRGGISGAARIARHLWRMCLGFFFAAASALTQIQKVLPTHVLGVRVLYILLVLAVMPLVMLVFWMIRVRFTNWFRNDAALAPQNG